MICFACTHPNDYEYDSLRWMNSVDQLCDKHIKEFEGMAPPKKPSNLFIKPFIPPIIKVPAKNFQEREVGEEG